MRPGPARTLLAACVVLLIGAPLHAQTVDSLTLRDHARALAADSLMGRGTASPGERLAARYIAARLREMGVEAGANGFRMPLPLVRARLRPESRIAVATGDTLRFGPDDFALGPVGRSGMHAFEGPAVFVGRTDEAPPPTTLAGSVVVTVGPLGEEGGAALRDWARAGVAGVLVPVEQTGSGDPVRFAVDAPVDDPVWQPALPVLYIGPDVVRALFDGADTGTMPVDLPFVRAGLELDTGLVSSANVFGILPGTDPGLRAEVILLTAHYDHLGVGPAVDGDSIFNGFSDNAAGVAMLLEIARVLEAERPARTVAFLFTSGEERGLLGATYFASLPPMPLRRIRAVVNLDAGAPPAPPVRWRVAGDSTAIAVRTAAAVVREHGWTTDITTATANSDHWPFQARGVPTVFLVPGRDWEGLDDTGRDALFERWDRYHQPGDEWHPDFPLAGLTRYAELALAITRALAGG